MRKKRGQKAPKRGVSGRVSSRGTIKKSTFRPFFLVSMKVRQTSILLLYERENVYCAGARDMFGNWWDFSITGGVLFADSLGLGFEESYSKMELLNRRASVGLQQLEHAIFVFSNPAAHFVDDRKIAAQIIIAVTSEAGRCKILERLFDNALNDNTGLLNVDGDGEYRLLMRNWETLSSHILKEYAKDTVIGEKISNNKLVELLGGGGMFNFNNPENFFGLLIRYFLIICIIF